MGVGMMVLIVRELKVLVVVRMMVLIRMVSLVVPVGVMGADLMMSLAVLAVVGWMWRVDRNGEFHVCWWWWTGCELIVMGELMLMVVG